MITIAESQIKSLQFYKYSAGNVENSIGQNLSELLTEHHDFFAFALLKPFVNQIETYGFAHPVNASYNVLQGLSLQLFQNHDFIEISSQIFKHLQSCSQHHNINDGDVFIAQFQQIEYQGETCGALGVFKFEEKENFIETSTEQNGKLQVKQGFTGKKPEKACLIIRNSDDFTILVIDAKTETNYWQNDFIQAKPKQDFVNQTHRVLQLTKNYIVKQIEEDFEVSKADKIDLLNKSVQYFKNHEQFEQEDFEKEVFDDESVIESFRNYNQLNTSEADIQITDSFQISQQAVKKQTRNFKSVLKLDKNFHIYIHGDRKLIENGVDANGRKFYKIYYTEEN